MLVINLDESGVYTVLNPTNGRVFILNDVGRRIIELSDGNHTLEGIVNTILAEFAGAERASVERDVADFVTGCLEPQILAVN